MVGEYRIDGLIGRGAMGAVYAVTQPVIEKRAAVKVVHRDLSTRGDAVARFVDEARAAGRISHPNIVDIFSFGTLPDGRPYLVMPLLEGGDLAELLRSSALDMDERLSVLEQICRALAAAHAKQVVHRDLKPQNVFITPDVDGAPLVKLLDFGIAKLGGDTNPTVRRTHEGLVMGTPLYLSPEQARGEPVDARCDIYSLGVIAFEMLVGRPPFLADSAIELMHMHTTAPPPAPSSLWPAIPPSLERLLERMLSKDPARRPSIAETRATLLAARVVLAAGDLPPQPTTAPMRPVPSD